MEDNVLFKCSEPNDEQISAESRLFRTSQVVFVVNIAIAIILLFIGIKETDSYREPENGWMLIGISVGMILGSFLLHFFITVVKEISISLKRLVINQK